MPPSLIQRRITHTLDPRVPAEAGALRAIDELQAQLGERLAGDIMRHIVIVGLNHVMGTSGHGAVGDLEAAGASIKVRHATRGVPAKREPQKAVSRPAAPRQTTVHQPRPKPAPAQARPPEPDASPEPDAVLIGRTGGVHETGPEARPVKRNLIPMW